MALTRNNTPIEDALSERMHSLESNINQTVIDWRRMPPGALFVGNKDVASIIKKNKTNETNKEDINTLIKEEMFHGLAPTLQSYIAHHAHHGSLHALTLMYYLEELAESSTSFKDDTKYKYFILNNNIIFCEIIDIASISTPFEDKQKHARNEVLSNLAKRASIDYKPPPIAKMLTVSKISLNSSNQVEHEILFHRNFVLSETHGKKLFPEENDNTMFWFDADEDEVTISINNIIDQLIFEKKPSAFQRYKPLLIVGGIILGVSIAIFLALLVPPVGALVLGLATKLGISAFVASSLGLTLTAAHIGAVIATSLTAGYALMAGAATAISNLFDRVKSASKQKAKNKIDSIESKENNTTDTPDISPKIGLSSTAHILIDSRSEDKETFFVIPAKGSAEPGSLEFNASPVRRSLDKTPDNAFGISLAPSLALTPSGQPSVVQNLIPEVLPGMTKK